MKRIVALSLVLIAVAACGKSGGGGPAPGPNTWVEPTHPGQGVPPGGQKRYVKFAINHTFCKNGAFTVSRDQKMSLEEAAFRFAGLGVVADEIGYEVVTKWDPNTGVPYERYTGKVFIGYDLDTTVNYGY